MSTSQTEPNAYDELVAGLERLSSGFDAAFAAATDEHALRAAHAKYAGATGELTQLLKLMPKIPGDKRKDSGQRANAVKATIEEAFGRALSTLKDRARQAELSGPYLDVTLPGRSALASGLHPITRTIHELVEVFRGLGFYLAEGPEIELADFNFTKLGFPPDHPAMEMHDTFFVQRFADPAAAASAAQDESRIVLRTHTSPVQVREMLKRKPPFACVAPGVVYRRDDDATHSPMFCQFEGLYVGEGVTMAHLRGVLARFAEVFFGKGTPIRLRPSYFPFVEPGGEVDVGCAICRGWASDSGAAERRAACRVCKGTGFLEILGCGMVHPVVFEQCGIDPERYSGFAFGFGVDRIAMMRWGVPNIRMLYDGDPRVLAQMADAAHEARAQTMVTR